MLEPQCRVQLLHNNPLYIGAFGARTCWTSGDKSDTTTLCSNCKQKAGVCNCGHKHLELVCGQKDAELLDRVGNKFKHASILEHLTYNFFIGGISRALLQELARHRMASLSVKSTRYTLKELKEEKIFAHSGYHTAADKERSKKYLVMTGVDEVDTMSIRALENLRRVLVAGISNDRAKYCLPESYKTELTWTINARSLQNFIFLRSDKAALWEIRDLAQAVYDALPEDHKYLYEEKLRFDAQV